MYDEINKYSPTEIIGNGAFLSCDLNFDYMKEKMKITISEAPSHYFNDDTCEDFIKRQFKVGSIDGLGI